MGAVPLGEVGDEGVVFLQLLAHQQRQTDRDELVDVRQMVVTPQALLDRRLRG